MTFFALTTVSIKISVTEPYGINSYFLSKKSAHLSFKQDRILSDRRQTTLNNFKERDFPQQGVSLDYPISPKFTLPALQSSLHLP